MGSFGTFDWNTLAISTTNGAVVKFNSQVDEVSVDVTFTVDYLLAVNVSTQTPGEYAAAYVGASLGLVNMTTSIDDIDLDNFFIEVANGNAATVSASSSLSISVFFNDGDEGFFTADMSSDGSASIPSIPVASSFWLMLPAFFGIFIYRRRNVIEKT